MKNFTITADNDLALVTNARGKRALNLISDPAVAGAVKLYLRFQFFEGEWYLDLRQGVPYYKLVLVKNPDLAAIKRLFRHIILSIKVFESADTQTFNYDARERTLDFTFEAFTADGRKVEGGVGKPFVVDNRAIVYSGESAAL